MGRPSSDFLICMDRFTKAKFIMIASEYFMTCSFPTSLQFLEPTWLFQGQGLCISQILGQNVFVCSVCMTEAFLSF